MSKIVAAIVILYAIIGVLETIGGFFGQLGIELYKLPIPMIAIVKILGGIGLIFLVIILVSNHFKMVNYLQEFEKTFSTSLKTHEENLTQSLEGYDQKIANGIEDHQLKTSQQSETLTQSLEEYDQKFADGMEDLQLKSSQQSETLTHNAQQLHTLLTYFILQQQRDYQKLAHTIKMKISQQGTKDIDAIDGYGLTRSLQNPEHLDHLLAAQPELKRVLDQLAIK